MEFSYKDAFRGSKLIADRVLRCADQGDVEMVQKTELLRT